MLMEAQIPKDLLAETARMLLDRQRRHWISATSHAVFFYDLILTSRDEYRYIWRARWSLGKVLYILIRYPLSLLIVGTDAFLENAPASLITLQSCSIISSWQIIGGWLQFTIVQVIMGLRTVAICDFRPDTIILICVLGCISSITILSVDIVYLLRATHAISVPVSNETVCIKTCLECLKFCKYKFFPMAVFDAVVFFITLYRSHRHSNLKGPLIIALYHDGFIHFAIILILVITNIIVYMTLTARPSLVGSMTPPLRSMLGIMCGRLLLNLRGAILRQSDHNSIMASRSQNILRPTVSAGVGIWNLPTLDVEVQE